MLDHFSGDLAVQSGWDRRGDRVQRLVRQKLLIVGIGLGLIPATWERRVSMMSLVDRERSVRGTSLTYTLEDQRSILAETDLTSGTS